MIFDYIKIKYRNTYDLGELYYQDPDFWNWLYLEADIGRPEYIRVEEGTDANGDKVFYPTFQKMRKQYKVEFIAPEYLLDALTLLPLHDTIWVYDKFGGSEQITDCSIEYSWLEGDCLAKVIISFSIDYEVKTTCNSNMTASACLDVTEASVYNSVANYASLPTAGITYNNKRYLVRNGDIYRCGVEGGIYIWSIASAKAEGKVVFSETEHINYYCDGSAWNKYPYLTRVSYVISQWHFIGYAPPNTFVQIYIDRGDGHGFVVLGDPYTSDDLVNGNIYEPETPEINATFYFYCYTHGCDIGYSNNYSYNIIP